MYGKIYAKMGLKNMTSGNSHSRYKAGLLALLVFLFGLLFGKNLERQKIVINKTAVLECREKFKLVNQRRCVMFKDVPTVKEDKNIKTAINAFIAQSVQDGLIDAASVAYRGFSSGDWFRINENILYSPGSLLKVPLMVAYLKQAETHPEVLTKKILYDGSFDENGYQVFKPAKTIEENKGYAVDELIKYMVSFSDNNATRLLQENMDISLRARVYEDFGVEPYQNPFISIRNYAPFLMRLFSLTYLNREMSEKALELLVTGDFSQGIASMVPLDIKVAQKFGHNRVFDPKTKELVSDDLHDCGIVYYPQHPYLLCIMTKGKDFDKQAKVIQEISSLVYRKVSETRQSKLVGAK